MRTIEIENGVEKNISIIYAYNEKIGSNNTLVVRLKDENGNKKTFRSKNIDFDFVK